MSGAEDSLDLTILNERKEILEEGLEELLNEYLDVSFNQLSSLRSAVDSKDIHAVNLLAHTVNGCSYQLYG